MMRGKCKKKYNYQMLLKKKINQAKNKRTQKKTMKLQALSKMVVQELAIL